MQADESLKGTLIGIGSTAARAKRTVLIAVEHNTIVLPVDIVRADGSLDLYEDVQKLFKPVFEKGHPAIQSGGWLGYIPLNDRYALEVNPRVPIGNLERLIGLAAGYSPQVLKKFTRYFAHTREQPAALFDVLVDQLLAVFDRIWDAGLLKQYERRTRIGASPVGRIKPFESAWRTQNAGRPTAISTAFCRTPDFGPNRLLRKAFEIMLQRYLELVDAPRQKSRVLQIRRALERLDDVNRPSVAETSPHAVARYLIQLPVYHAEYADALMLSQLVLDNMSLAVRGDGLAVVPTILIDMSKVFEKYARRLLDDRLANVPGADVRDGNKRGAQGAKQDLFNDIRAGLQNPSVTPDIVVMVRGQARLIVDTKYKPTVDIPDRSDINQVIGYGARYGCEKVMVLYAGRSGKQKSVQMVGKAGRYTVFTGHIDLGMDAIEDEEQALSGAVAALLAA